MRETFLVRAEGVRACTDSDDLNQWPAHYRIGVLNGLFFDEQEQLTLDDWMASIASRLTAPVLELTLHIDELRTKVSHVDDPLRGLDFGQATEIHRLLTEGARRLPEDAQPAWTALADLLEPQPPF